MPNAALGESLPELLDGDFVGVVRLVKNRVDAPDGQRQVDWAGQDVGVLVQDFYREAIDVIPPNEEPTVQPDPLVGEAQHGRSDRKSKQGQAYDSSCDRKDPEKEVVVSCVFHSESGRCRKREAPHETECNR